MQTNPDWAFDDECPECGEEEKLAAFVEVAVEKEPTEAELMCERCLHTWRWECDNGDNEQ